jgi:hypothetical protein
MCKYEHDLCVQVKNKPCIEFTVIMRFIFWIHSSGSETVINEKLSTPVACRNVFI